MKSRYIVFVLFLFIGSGFPQDSVFTPKYALSFGIGNNFTLTKLNGEIAVKKILKNSNQIRLLFQPSYFDNSIDYPTSLQGTFYDYENSQFSIGIGADYLWSVTSHSDVLLYAGPGISFVYHSSINKDRSYLFTGEIRFSETEMNVSDIELRGTLGVE